MLISLLIVRLTAATAAIATATRSAFRRAVSRPRTPQPALPPVATGPEIAAEPPQPAAVPVLEAAPVEILDPAEITKRIRQVELGIQALGPPLPDDDPLVAAAFAAIGDPATQRRYTPRRPNLLPQLMRAISDEDFSRRELSAIIARDPAIVGSLLKMANSAYYRVAAGQVESIERAVVILGNDGLRSLVAASLMQPIFQVHNAKVFARFPEIVWDHAQRSAHAAIPHAALVEKTDAFAAELLCLITGLAEIVLFRAAMDHCSNNSPSRQHRPAPQLIAALLASQSAVFAWRIGLEWNLSELMLAALEEQMVESEPTTKLGRSLRFGRCAGALAVLHANSIIDDTTVRLSLPAAGLSAAHLKCMWARLLQEHKDPRMIRKMAA